MNKKAIKSKITKILRASIIARRGAIGNLIPEAFTDGKLYEAYVLALVCDNLKSKEGCELTLIGGKKIVLKSSHGPINYLYPHIKVTKNGSHIADIWTDIEFHALSYINSGAPAILSGDFHEIDIAVVTPNCTSNPEPENILIAVECKNTGYEKNLLREILGVRRELSLLDEPQRTIFSTWPAKEVPAKPPSCVLVFSTDINASQYIRPGSFFGIQFHHEPF